MRKEIIIRIHVNSDKCQAKAMKVAAAVSGVESVTLAGGDKSLLLVIGDCVDSNKLVKKLKKKVGEAEIVELRTHDMFEEAAAALPLPATKQELAMAMAAARSPYNNNHQWQHYSYAAAPTSPYSYQYHHPSPAGGYGYGYGYGAGMVSNYSRAVARSHPANYSPLVERHDYLPMDHYSSSSSSKRKQTMAVPRRGSGGTSGCTIL